MNLKAQQYNEAHKRSRMATELRTLETEHQETVEELGL